MTSTPEHLQSAGAQPVGAANPAEVADKVRRMFDGIAPTYDRANHLLSAGLDRSWWRRAAHTFSGILARPEALILDLCCGTGDMTAALLTGRPQSPGAEPVTGVDFSAPMLDRAREKHAGANARFLEADALHLPFPNATFDLVTAAFGFRNLSSYTDGLLELHRVLRPGGKIGILEANQPEGPIGIGYNLYFHHILPRIGGLISGQPAAYRYLPTSVQRFPRPPRMLALMRDAGFGDAAWTSYTFGTAGLYTGTRS